MCVYYIYVIRVDDSTRKREKEKKKEGFEFIRDDLTISVSFFQCPARNFESQPK